MSANPLSVTLALSCEVVVHSLIFGFGFFISRHTDTFFVTQNVNIPSPFA